MNPNPPFFGTKVSKTGINVTQATPNQLLYQLDLNTGTQTFYSVNGEISYGNFTSAVTGNLSQGMQVVNSDGYVTFEMDGQTWYWFDNLGNIVMEVGYLQLPQIYGWAVAVPGSTLAGEV
jgi:hypothetical protein